uniref:Non-structural protein 5 n=1 Tax=Rotavirus B (isolate RVB/Human/China/ADRV/1982) TaxID=10942 RepID=I7ENI9_ROTGA|nr:nonstructural protein NSP5 [Human rotavirus B]
MAEASEFNFTTKRKQRTMSDRRTREDTKQKKIEEKSDVDLVDSASVYSQESARSNYSDAYDKLKREPIVEESNDAKYRNFEFSEDEEVYRPSSKTSDKSYREMKRKYDSTSTSDSILEKLSELNLEIEKIKQMNQPVTIDAAFNMILRNVDNLTIRQKQALINAIINSMN